MEIDRNKKTYQVTLDVPQGIKENYVKEAMVSLLYYNGKLTEKEARTMIGKTRRQFEEEIIPKFGLSMIGGTKEDIEIERSACLK